MKKRIIPVAKLIEAARANGGAPDKIRYLERSLNKELTRDSAEMILIEAGFDPGFGTVDSILDDAGL